MTAEKIDWQRLAMEAGDLAQDDVDCGLIGSGDWAFRRDKHFARLMLEEAAKVCESVSVLHIPNTHNWTALKVQETLIDAIRARMP